ncbi:hypothetical protein KQX54_020670 [Cotesia glomerata]|uniref:Uncharacterized protein n=1 Tax=Cotesia glomerata TaxID=32391 RepID=A0AAV7JAA9_COTGL|nr:hypothetical protein KQX54_020670 [Cotesia glomerata]
MRMRWGSSVVGKESFRFELVLRGLADAGSGMLHARSLGMKRGDVGSHWILVVLFGRPSVLCGGSFILLRLCSTVALYVTQAAPLLTKILNSRDNLSIFRRPLLAYSLLRIEAVNEEKKNEQPFRIDG